MRNSSKLALGIVLCLLIHVNTQSRIPSYLGKGYDIVYGNPSTNIIDPGFRFDVIAFDYNTNTKTEDGRYIIPDAISSQKSQSCSYSSSVSEFRGTQAYQDELKVNVQVSGGYSGPAVKASFTASFGYRNMQQKIENQQTIIYQASAKCESYKLTMDRFKTYKFSASFASAVESSLSWNDWSSFISQYGTHYVSEVMFGGRAIQESEFTRTAVATLRERGIDIGLAVKASYAGYFGEANSQTSITSSQQSQMESLRTKTTNYYIGGVPPGKGNIQDWQVQVNSSPMPILYNVAPLSDLFAGIPGKDYAWFLKARTSFYAALDAYCNGRCKTPTAAKPLPVKTCNLYSAQSPLYGGNGGGDFRWLKYEAEFHVTKLNIRSGAQVDGIQIGVSKGDNRTQFEDSGYYGGNGGGQRLVYVAQGDFITKIQLRSGARVDKLTFITKRGQRWDFGGDGGSAYEVVPPTEDYRLIGIVGKSGARVDKIGFLFAYNYCNISHRHKHVRVVYPQPVQ